MELKSELVRVLNERGFVHQCTDLAALDARCAEGPITAYIGFDLTAQSLHVGSLIQIMLLRWMVRLGHNPIILMGEATTRIGDPTGKDKARPMLSNDEIEGNRQGIGRVFDNLVLPLAIERARETERPFYVPKLTNAEWFHRMQVMDYLREFGPHFTINRMLTFDSVQLRLSKQDPMTFLEFNYMLMQAIDFLALLRHRDCELQLGGSDQWGNIINGVELIRRVEQRQAFGLTTPLMTNSAGEKMGKTATGAVWLSGDHTSADEFWQFWRNIEDTKVEEFLKLFTELPLDAIATIIAGGINEAKKTLADEVTAMVHGREAAEAARQKAQAIFEQGDLSAADVREIERRPGITLADILLEVGMVRSKSDADRLVSQKGVRLDGVVLDSVRDVIPPTMFETPFTLSVGKKNIVRIQLGAA